MRLGPVGSLPDSEHSASAAGGTQGSFLLHLGVEESQIQLRGSQRLLTDCPLAHCLSHNSSHEIWNNTIQYNWAKGEEGRAAKGSGSDV